MRKKIILVMFLILIIISLLGCQTAVQDTKSTTGGVIICNEDYPCGNADNICPESFGAECRVADPDCK